MIEQRLIYVPVKLADQIEGLKIGNKIEEKIKEFIDESDADIKQCVSDLDDGVKIYVGLMAKARDAYHKAKEDELSKNYELWEKFDEELPDVKKKVKKIVDELRPVEDQMRKVNEQIKNLDTNKLEKIIELMEKFKYMDNDTKNIFKFLMENYGD